MVYGRGLGTQRDLRSSASSTTTATTASWTSRSSTPVRTSGSVRPTPGGCPARSCVRWSGRMPRSAACGVGVAYTNGNLPEGLNSLRGETPYGYDFFEPVYVKGRRQRLGVELDWTPGPTSLRAEWIQIARGSARSRVNRNRDLSDLLGTGWYVSGTWFVTGRGQGSEHQHASGGHSWRPRGDRTGRPIRGAGLRQRQQGRHRAHAIRGRRTCSRTAIGSGPSA